MKYIKTLLLILCSLVLSSCSSTEIGIPVTNETNQTPEPYVSLTSDEFYNQVGIKDIKTGEIIQETKTIDLRHRKYLGLNQKASNKGFVIHADITDLQKDKRTITTSDAETGKVLHKYVA